MTQKNKQSNRDKTLEDIFKKEKFLTKKSSFNFNCNACGKCCFNQDIILTTYDMLRLRRELQKPTMAILAEYCTVHCGPTSRMPVCLLKFRQSELNRNGLKVCPFLRPRFDKEVRDALGVSETKEEGEKRAVSVIKKNIKAGNTDLICSIYNDRPEVCKLYPLGRGFLIDAKKRTRKIKYFKIEKKELLCDEKCYECKNTVGDYLKTNGLDDPEKIELQTEYNSLISEFAKIAMKQKVGKFEEYETILLYFSNFDLMFVLQRLNELKVDDKSKIIDSVALAGETQKEMVLKLAEISKKYKLIDFKLLSKTMEKDCTEQDLKDFFRHLLDIYSDILVKLKEKYV